MVFAFSVGTPDLFTEWDDYAHRSKSSSSTPFLEWSADAQPTSPSAGSLIYESTVRGLPQLHRDVPGELRGTYAGIAHPAVIEHLQKLGITAIDPVFYRLPFERFIPEHRDEEPDIDVDFVSDRPEDVIQRVYERSGRHTASPFSYTTRSLPNDPPL